MLQKKAIQVQLARARTTVQLQAHDMCNCIITAEIRPADDQQVSNLSPDALNRFYREPFRPT